MKHLLSITSLAGIFAVTSLSADWTVVSTFDDESAGDLIEDVTNIPDSGARSEIENGQWAVYPGNLFDQTSNLFALLDLGTDVKAEALANDGIVTIYFEFTQPLIDGEKALLDTVWGLSNVDETGVLENGFTGYNAMQRINSGSNGFEGRDGESYYEIAQLEADVKYSMWMVVDFGLNYYRAYVQGGQWEEVTEVPSPDPQSEGLWFFRENPGDAPVEYFRVSLSRGNTDEPKGEDPAYFDNVAYDATGENLTVPGGEPPVEELYLDTWPVDADGWANTESWFGWVYVEFEPWVYSNNLGSYIWVDEGSFSEAGSWTYVPRVGE